MTESNQTPPSPIPPSPIPPNPSTAEARVLVDELVRNGVDRFVIAPGSRSTALALAALGDDRTRCTVSIDERSAGFHALGLARASGHPAGVIVTSGTAAANLLPAVVEADLSRTPAVMLTADRPPELQQVSANQTIDQTRLFGASVRWFCDVGVAEDRTGSNLLWRTTACRAVAEARGGGGLPPGPVHLNLPFREPLVPASDDGRTRADPFVSDVEGRAGGAPWTRVVTLEPDAVALPADLAGLERGVVVAGTAGPPVHEAAAALAAELGWPLIAEPSSGGRPRGSITTAHFLAAHAGFVERHRPQTAVVFGRADLSPAVRAMLHGVPTVVVDPWGWADPDRTAGSLVKGWPMLPGPAGAGRAGSGWLRAWTEAEEAVRASVDAALDDLPELTEPRVARDAAASVPGGGWLVVASSMPVRDLDMFMAASDIHVTGNRGGSGIDGFVSTALGVAAAAGTPVVALAGDLSVLHDQNGFLLEPRPDCVFVVVDNDGGGIFSFLPQAAHPDGFERLFGTPHGRDFGVLAELHGIEHVRVERPDDLAAEVAGRLAGGLHLVEVRTDRRRNVEVHRRIAARVSAAVERLVS